MLTPLNCISIGSCSQHNYQIKQTARCGTDICNHSTWELTQESLKFKVSLSYLKTNIDQMLTKKDSTFYKHNNFFYSNKDLSFIISCYLFTISLLTLSTMGCATLA